MAAEADKGSVTFAIELRSGGEIMRWWIAAVLMVVVGMGVRAQGDAPVTKLFEVPISDIYASIEDVKWSPDGRYIAAQVETRPQADGQTWRFWNIYDAVSGEQIISSVLLIWYADGQRALIGNETSKPTSWDLRKGEVFSLLRSPDSTQHYRYDELIYGDIALLEAETLYVYDADDGALKFTRTDVTTRPMYSPDQTHAAVETSEGIEVYETAAWTLIDSLPDYRLHMPWLEQPIWSGDNQHLIVSKGEYRLAFHPTYIWTVGEGPSAPIFNIDSAVWWSPDGTQMAEANDAEIRFFDSTTGERLSTIRGLPVGDGLPMGGGRIVSVNGLYMVTMHGVYGLGLPYAAVTNLETGEVVFSQSVGIAILQIIDDMLVWHEWGGFIKIIDLTGNLATVTHSFPYGFSAFNTSLTWVLAVGDPFATARAVLYRADPFTEYPLITIPSNGAVLNFRWSPDGRRFALYGGEANMISVWEITAD